MAQYGLQDIRWGVQIDSNIRIHSHEKEVSREIYNTGRTLHGKTSQYKICIRKKKLIQNLNCFFFLIQNLGYLTRNLQSTKKSN